MVNKGRVANIPAHLPFMDTLIGWLRSHYGPALPEVAVFLPSRQTVELARQRFAATCDTACRLPLLLPLMELDEQGMTGVAPDTDTWRQMLSWLAPAIRPTQRKSLLIRLVHAYYRRHVDHLPSLDQVTQLSEALGKLLDEMQQQQLPWARLRGIVPEGLAHHWQETMTFMEILSSHWPEVLAEQGRTDVWQRRNHILGALAGQWERFGLQRPVVIAGSTGSIPSTMKLMQEISRQENGLIVLPGLDAGFEGQDELPISHPQAGLQRLVKAMGIAPSTIVALAGEAEPTRSRLLRRMFGTSGTTALRGDPGFKRFDCRTPDEEAHLAAMLALEAAGRKQRCIIASEQPQLKQRVALMLRSKGIEPYQVGGGELGQGGVLTFLRLLAQAHEAEFAPVPLLAMLRHALARFGYAKEELREVTGLLEMRVLRGLRPAAGLSGLEDAIWKLTLDEVERGRLLQLHARLQQCFISWAVAPADMSFDQLLQQHLLIAEDAARGEAMPGHELLWQGEEGRAAADILLDLRQAKIDIAVQGLPEYETLLKSFFSSSCPGGTAASHVWLASPRDVRLVQADRVVLCGLNEGSWPPEHRGDPWMSQPMRAAVALPLAGELAGQSAHDFWMLAHASETILLRSEHDGGAPTVPSRWLSQLDGLAHASSELAEALRSEEGTWSGWLHGRRDVQPTPPYPRPDPAVPSSAKPRSLSVSAVERLMHDPYRFYAERILALKELPGLDQPLDRADFGNLLHAVLERFVKAYPGELPHDAWERLQAYLGEVGSELLGQPMVASLWKPRIGRLLEWFLAEERRRRPGLVRVGGEQTVRMAHEGGITLTGRIDRVERDRAGTIHVIDYKTGAVPSRKQVWDGARPQLPMLAWLLEAQQGGRDAKVGSLAYWRFTGGDTGGEACAVAEGAEETAALITRTTEAIASLLEAYGSDGARFRAEPGGKADSDFDHFSRWKEWAA